MTARRRTGAASIAAGALFAAGVLLTAVPVEAVLPPAAARLESAVRGAAGLRADFVQIRVVELTGEEIEARGFLAFRPPAAFRLAYLDADGQEVVVAGDSLWVYMPAEQQAIRYPFDADAPGSEIFLLFGGRNRKLDDVYHVIEEPWADRVDALRLELRDPEPGYPIEEIRLLVDAAGFPERLFYRELTGDVVVFRFTRVTPAPADLDELVRLRLAPGTEVLDGAALTEESDR